MLGAVVSHQSAPLLPVVSVRDQPSDVWGTAPGQSLDSGRSRSRGVLIMSVSADPVPELLGEHNTLSSQLQTVTVTTQRESDGEQRHELLAAVTRGQSPNEHVSL